MVYIILGTGFEEMEAVCPCDMLRRAGVDVQFAGIGGTLIKGGNGITVQEDCTVEDIDPEKLEMIVPPGGMGGVRSVLGCETAMKAVQQAYDSGKFVAAICAAPTLLDGWGLLEGKKAVCYPTWADRMLDGEYCSGQKVVRDGKIITAQAAGAAYEFGLALIEALVDEATARRVAQEIYL